MVFKSLKTTELCLKKILNISEGINLHKWYPSQLFKSTKSKRANYEDTFFENYGKG